jgi:hypothetical protein
MLCHITPHDYFNMNYACARAVCVYVCYSIKSDIGHSERQSFNDHLSRDRGTSHSIIEGDGLQC